VPIITLTSDFGSGVFVGLLKGVILGICPEARLVDLAHDLLPQDVRGGALALEQAIGVFPSGAVHLAVVDPGVGTERRAMALAAAGMLWVGPDNGLFTAALLADPQARAYRITDQSLMRQPVSATFHGRDVFAAAAAHLAQGRAVESLGPRIYDPVRLDWPQPRQEGGALLGQVLTSDRFGNLMTNLPRARVEALLAGRPARIRCQRLEIKGLGAAYGQAEAGQPVAVFNSLDRLELALNQGDLRAHLGLERGGVFGLAVRVEADE